MDSRYGSGGCKVRRKENFNLCFCFLQPNVYRLMQLGRQFIPTAAKFDHVFSNTMTKNRVELVSDFPNDAEVISSLQVSLILC